MRRHCANGPSDCAFATYCAPVFEYAIHFWCAFILATCAKTESSEDHHTSRMLNPWSYLDLVAVFRLTVTLKRHFTPVGGYTAAAVGELIGRSIHVRYFLTHRILSQVLFILFVPHVIIIITLY